MLTYEMPVLLRVMTKNFKSHRNRRMQNHSILLSFQDIPQEPTNHLGEREAPHVNLAKHYAINSNMTEKFTKIINYWRTVMNWGITPHTAEALKRIAGRIFDRGGVIRQIDNLGEQPTPYKTSAHGVSHRRAHYFVFHFNVPPRKIEDFREECERDVDLIRSNVFKTIEDEKPKPCTFHEEMLPPAYRPQVQKLVEIASRQKAGYTMEWKWNSGLDFYPFQR